MNVVFLKNFHQTNIPITTPATTMTMSIIIPAMAGGDKVILGAI